MAKIIGDPMNAATLREAAISIRRVATLLDRVAWSDKRLAFKLSAMEGLDQIGPVLADALDALAEQVEDDLISATVPADAYAPVGG